MKTFKVSTVLPNESIFFQSLHDLKKYTGSKIVGYRGVGTQKFEILQEESLPSWFRTMIPASGNDSSYKNVSGLSVEVT